MSEPEPIPAEPRRPTSPLRTLLDGALLLVLVFTAIFAVLFLLAAAVAGSFAFAIGSPMPNLGWFTAAIVVPLAYGLTLLAWVPRMSRRHPDHPLLVRRVAEIAFVAGMAIGFGVLLKRL